MVDTLKKEIERKIDRKIKNRGDCEFLSLMILEILDETISYNTLRRFFGLTKFTKPNIKTLNILARFIGFNGYTDFYQNFGFKGRTSLFQISYQYLYNENEDEILDLIKEIKRSNEDFTGFITLLIRELFHEKKISLIDKIFDMQELFMSSFNYSDLLYLGNSIGLLLRKKDHVDKILSENQNFLNCVYLIFVDYSSLNSYYGDWTTSLLNQNISNEINLFTSALLKFIDFLNNKTVNDFEEDLCYSTDIHPILCSRLLSIKFLARSKFNTEEVLKKYYSIHSKNINLTDYSFELYTTAILAKNLYLMKFLIEKVNLKIEFYYHKNHLNSYHLMCAFYFKLINNTNEGIKSFNKFSLNESLFSYNEFISLLHLIYLHATAKTIQEENKIINQYIKLSNKLGYPFFSKEYLLNYFR